MEYLDNRKSFFEAVSEKVNIGSYDEFLKKIESPDNRKNLFDALSESYNIGTFEEYESKLGFSNQAIPNQKSSVSGGEQAFTQSDEALQQDKPANKFSKLFRNPHQENYFKDILNREAREKDRISYVTDPYKDDDLTQFTPKKEQTYQDIMINQSELFKATPKGQEDYSKFMDKQTSVLNKYLDKYKNTPEYRKHLENYQKEYSTAVVDEQKAAIDKKYSALLEERLHGLYGAEMNTELEPAMGEYYNALYETRKASIDGATQRLGRTYTQAKLPEIKKSINDALSEHRNSPENKKARDEEFKRQERLAMFNPELAHNTFAATEFNLSLTPVVRQLNAAKKRIEKSEDMIEAALQGKGLGAGFIDQAKRINNWTYGFNDFIENADVRQVIEKAEKDENSLTKSEKALLDAVALEASAIQYFSYQLSRGYKAGTTTAESLPFMVEFMVNPLSGSGRALAKSLGKWAVKRGITGVGLKSLTFGSRMLGDMLGAAGMTATSSIGRVASGVEERMIGNVGSYVDVEGVHFTGREGEQTFSEAVRNSVADNLVENYSEMFFGAFEGGSKAIRGFLKSSPLKGLPKKQVFEIAKNLFSSYDKFQRAVQFHGYLGEVSEEYIGNLLRLGVTTDTEASDMFNADAQIDTWLGLLPTSAAFGIIGVSGRGINKYSRYKDTHRMNYEKFKASLSSKELASFENVEAHINAGDTEFTKYYIKETLSNEELNDAQKSVRLLAVYGAMYDKNYDDFRNVEIASIEERLHNKHYNKNTNGIMTVATDKKSGNIVFVTGAADNGELIVEGIDGTQETVPADRLEDMRSVDYYSTLKSIAEGEFARNRVGRLYKEGDEVQDRDGNNFTVSQLSNNGVIIKNSEGELAKVPFMYFDDNFTSKAEVDIEQADNEIDKQTNNTNGRVTNVKIGGKEGVFYIKAGNLVVYQDDNENVIIDKEHSDETFVVVDAETGEAKQVGINQIDEVLGDAAPIELKEQSHDEIRNATENKKAFPVGALVYNEGMPNVFTTVIDNGGYGFSIATVNEKTGRLENVPISNDAKEGWKTLNLSEGNVLQTNLSKFEIISNEGDGNLMVSIDGEEAVRMGTAELAERLQYEGFNLSSYIENESKKTEKEEEAPEQLQEEEAPEQLEEEEDDQYSDADLYATVKALYKKRETQEKIANKPIDLTDQKAIKARETAKKNVEQLTEELAKWQAIINKRDERKKAEREKQNAISEERRAAIEAERIRQKELERIEREKAQGVPDVSVDNAEDARKRGYRIETGRMVERQQPQEGIIGNEREVVFSSKDKVKGKYKVVEAETLQESHINGKRNTKFFLTEAQPKERTDKASQMAAQKIAENLNPKQIMEGTTAYVGTPIANTRGEIIQGNNRTSALKYMYSQVPQKSAEYKQFLIDNADRFGLNAEEIAAMNNPVLVTEIDVTDEEAIRLGQKNAQDTESGGIQRIDSEKTATSLGDELYQFASRLMQSNDEEQSLSSTIEQNGRDALKILLSKNLINETQYQSAFNNKGELTPEAKEDLAGIVESIVFANSKNDNIKTMFNSLPQAAKKAILQTVARDAFNSEDVKVVPYIQEAIEIYYSLSLDTVFASAKTIEDVQKAAWSWSIQSQTDFVGNLFFPSQKYTNFALELAVTFKSQTMATQRAKFNELYDKLQGVGGDMFSETELLPFRDAVEKIYNVKLNKELGHVTNDGSHVLEVGSELGEERERGGTRGTRGDEQATSGARSADNREGVAGDNRKGTSNRQTKEIGKGKARLNKTQKEKAKKPAEDEKAKKPAEEEARRKEMSEKRAIAEGVTQKLNIDIEFVDNPYELPDSEMKARMAIQEGEKVGGWYNPKTNKAYLYIPNVTTANEVEKTILHEVVAHKGLRRLLGKKQFNALCDRVWQQMTGKERLYWIEYVSGAKTGQSHPLDIARAIGSQANRRAAADEFMAHMAENGIENKTAWQKIVEFVKDALRKMGFGEAFTDRELIEKDIKELLSKSYKRQTRNKENSITNEKESDVLFRFVDNTEHIKDDLEEEKNKYGGKRYKIVGNDIIVSTYFVVENSDQYSEIRYVSTSFDKALEYAKDYYDNDIDSDYVTIDLESSERAIPISEFKENNEEIWGNSFNEFEGSLENYIDTYIDDYLDSAGVDVGNETDEEPVRFVIQKGERDNKYTDKLIWDVEDEIERRFGVKVGKYSSFYVNREGNITDAYEDEQGRKNLSVTMRIADHTHNPENGKDDLNVLIADKDATSRRFFTATEDLVFNNDYTADEIVDEIEEYWRNYARDNYDVDELDIRFKIGEQITLPDNKTLEEYKSKFENPKDIITFALEENTISYGSKQKANETLRETVRNITETGKLRDDSGRKYILHDKNAQSRGKTSDSVIKKVTKRTVLKNFKESGFVEFAGTKIQTPQDIADLFSIHRSPNIEKYHLIFVDDKGVILGTHAYTSNLTEAVLLPNPVVVSDMYRKYNASGVYFLHNHPSGNHKVSLQDVASTDQLFKKLAEAGQNLIGHVVIDTDKFSYINISEKEYESDSYNQSLLNNYINEHVEEYEYKNAQANLFSERESIGSGKEAPRRLLEISKALLTANSSKGAIVYLTQNLDVAAYDVFPDSAKESDIIKIAEQGHKNHLGTRIAFVHDGSYSFPYRMPHFTLDVIDTKKGSIPFYTENGETPTNNQLWESQSEYGKGSKELEAIAKEMEAIKDKAIANGTFMKAPNGKPTKLNEKQWLQVRTKAFKKWFGDWELAAKEVEGKRLLDCSKVVDENGEPLVVYHGTLSKSFTIFNEKKGFNIEAIWHSKDVSVAAHFGGTSQQRRFDNGLLDRLNALSSIEDVVSFAQNELGLKVGVSKNIISKEDAKEFGVESGTFYRSYIEYNGGSSISGIIKYHDKNGVYSELKNAHTEKEAISGLKESLSSYAHASINHGSSGLYNDYISLKNPLIVDAKGSSYHQINFMGQKVNTEYIASYAKQNGYDGVIIRNVMETNYESIKTDDFISFSPSQIKSATDNVGTFDSENEDIRFRTRAVGGNSGYVGYSMSNRAAGARQSGRYPKTDFKKEYNVTEASLKELVNIGAISDKEWHHTSMYGNKTTFYSWAEDEYKDFYDNNKKEIDKLSREAKTLDLRDMFDDAIEQIQKEKESRREIYNNSQEKKRLDANSEISEKYKEYLDNVEVPSTYETKNGAVVHTNGSNNHLRWEVFKGETRLSKRKGKNARDAALKDAVEQHMNSRLDIEEWKEHNIDIVKEIYDKHGVIDITPEEMPMFRITKSRAYIPKVRGGWTKEKIIRYLKAYETEARGNYSIIEAIADYDTFEDFADNIYYHGTTNYIPKGLKASMAKSEKWAEQYGGGGYGNRYFGVSLTKRKRTAETFAGMKSHVDVYPVLLKKDANVIIREDLEDAIDIEDHIVEFYEQGVDAVWIGGGEQELVVINPQAAILYKKGRESFAVYGGFKSVQPTEQELREIYDKAKNEWTTIQEQYKSLKDKESRDEFIKELPTIRFRIGNKRKADMKAGLLNKLTNATEEQVERTISEIEKLGEGVKAGGDSKTEKVAYHWALKGTVILPEDNDKILQAIKVAEISKANPMEYNSPMELINKHDHIELKEKPIDPDTVPTLTNKQDLGNGITVYNVDESEESRENMRKIINTHLGKKRSPWCLLQGDENGQLTEQSAEFWRHYNEIPKRVAFHDGRLIAFSANDNNNVLWWDKQDAAHEGIPITRKIPNDELGRTGTAEYDENTGKFGKYSNIHKGNKENGLYEEWNENGQMFVRVTYKDGEENGLFEVWYDNGKMRWRANYKDGKMNGLYEVWYENGKLKKRTTYKDGKENGLYEKWYDNGQLETRATYKDGEMNGLYEFWLPNKYLLRRTIYYDGIEIKSLPTDVSLQELVDRGELDKKYLYDENDEENDIRFQKIPEPATPSSITDAIKPDESIIEYAKRQQAMFDGYSEERQQQIRDAVSDNMEKGGRLINRIYKNAFDANQPLERLQKNIQKQGGMVVNGVSDAYNDHFRSLGRATTAYDEFHSGVFSKFKNHLHSLSKKQLPTNIRWADKKNMTQIDKITLYLRAKDMVEAKSLGLPNRGEEGFAENVRRDNSYMTKVTPEEYVEEFERAVGTEDINLLWENVQEVNQWTLNYMEKNNFTDESIKEKYNRKYYVPQRGFEEGEAVSQRTRGRESNSNFNPALRKAKGRKSLSESPLAHMAQIAQSTIMQVEKNNTKRQFLNFCIANMRLGRVTGEFSVDKVHYKKTGRILENGLPEYEEVYGIIPYKELEQDAENRRELRRVKAELAKEGLGESERALLEKRAKQLSDAIIYEANVRLDQIRPQTKDNLEEHRVEVLYKGKRYSIFVNDVDVANALNRKDGEMGKWMKFFSTNLPFVPMITKYFSRILTQQNPSFALWNLLRDTGMGYMTNIVEHPNWVPTFTKNLTRTQSTIADYAFRGKLSEGKMGDYLKEFFAEGAQTGFSFINRMEDLKRQIERELNVDNTLADKILEGCNSVLQFFSNITEWSELTVRFSQYVTAREHGMTPAQAATEAKEVSVNFDRKGKLRLFYGLFSFFNAAMQGTNKMIRQWNNGHKIGLALYFSAHVASGVLNTLLMPDDPEDEKGYSEYDRMTNIVIGSWRIPLPQGLRAFHAIGVQIALAMQGQKTLQAAIMDALSFVFGEWLPINPIDGFYIDPSTNRLRYRADLGFRSFVPTFATPIYDVVTNTTYSGGTVHREPFVKTLDVPATMLSKKGVNGTLQELTDKLFELGGGNLTRKTMMRSDGTRVSELYNWNPSDIEFLTKAFTGGVGQFAMDMFDTGYNIATGNVNSFDDFAATMPVVKRAYKPYKEETSFNSAYYELLGKIKAAKESYNTLPKERRQIFDRAVSVMGSVDVNNPTKANLKSINNVLEDWNINYW